MRDQQEVRQTGSEGDRGADGKSAHVFGDFSVLFPQFFVSLEFFVKVKTSRNQKFWTHDLPSAARAESTRHWRGSAASSDPFPASF